MDSSDPDVAADGRALIDDDFLLLVNGWQEPVEFVFPAVGGHLSWLTEIDTGRPPAGTRSSGEKTIDAGGRISICDFSLVVLRGSAEFGSVALLHRTSAVVCFCRLASFRRSDRVAENRLCFHSVEKEESPPVERVRAGQLQEGGWGR